MSDIKPEEFAKAIQNQFTPEDMEFMILLESLVNDFKQKLAGIDKHIGEFTVIDPKQESPIFDVLIADTLKYQDRLKDVLNVGVRIISAKLKDQMLKELGGLEKKLMEELEEMIAHEKG